LPGGRLVLGAVAPPAGSVACLVCLSHSSER
jgi:hypothetical protein